MKDEETAVPCVEEVMKQSLHSFLKAPWNQGRKYLGSAPNQAIQVLSSRAHVDQDTNEQQTGQVEQEEKQKIHLHPCVQPVLLFERNPKLSALQNIAVGLSQPLTWFSVPTHSLKCPNHLRYDLGYPLSKNSKIK